MDRAVSVIRKEGSKYIIYSKTGKKLGVFDSEKEAKKRLREIEYFKHKGKSEFYYSVLEALSK